MDDGSFHAKTLASRFPDGAIPRYICKFLSPSTDHYSAAMDDIFLRSRVYLPSRLDFNDPLDTRFALDIPLDDNDLAKFVAAMATRVKARTGLVSQKFTMQEVREKILPATIRTLDSMGIYSLSDSVCHPLMWAHYADSHRGIALRFRHGTTQGLLAHPVRYSSEYPRGELTESGLPVHLCFVKGLDWEYEREWRMIESAGAHNYRQVPVEALHSVVLGARSTRETCTHVMNLCKERAKAGLPRLSIYKAEAGESFRLRFAQYIGSGEWRNSELS